MFRTVTSRQVAFDVTLAACCLLLRLAVGIESLTILLVFVAMSGALALRRLSPSLALIIAWAGALFQISTGNLPDVSNFAILPVLYATASYGTRRLKWIGLASAVLGSVIVAIYTSLGRVLYALGCVQASTSSCGVPGQLSSSVFTLVIFLLLSLTAFVLSWTFGLLAKTWRNARESSQASALAEQQRIAAQQIVVIEQERNRIARDMHDVVAHSLAVVIAQADGARYAAKQDPDAVEASLTTIASTARQALGEVRVLLGQLRHSQDEAPQPTLADVDRLFAHMRSSGLRITSHTEGEAVQLAAGQQLALYRIIQEALTNALRHGNISREVTVRVSWKPGSVVVDVSNALRVEPNPSAAGMPELGDAVGHGLAGMRERAELWGGTFSSGALDGMRYTVSVSCPISIPTTEAQ